MALLLLAPAAAQFDLGEDTLEGDPSELMDMSPDEMREALTKASLVPKPESGPFLLEGLAALREPRKDEGIGISPSSHQRKEQLAVFETVVRALIYIADDRLLDEMTEMSSSKDREVAQAVIRLMGLAGEAKAVETLQELAQGEDAGKRTVALLALGDTKAKSALQLLGRDWPGPGRLAARYAAERLRWQLGLSEPKPRGQKTGTLLFSGLERAPSTKGWRVRTKVLGKEADASDLATADLVLVGADADSRQWQAGEMAEALGRFLSEGGTLVCMGPGSLRDTGLVTALAKLNVQVPQQWEAKGITCRASYGDFHPILTAPYCIDEVRESVSAPGGWQQWSPNQRAPFRDRQNGRKGAFIFQCVGKGVVIFSAIDLIGDSFLRENLYAAAFGSECRNPKGFVWEMSHDWVSEHREWAKPTPGVKPRVLFLMPRLFKRGIVEIAQRMDLTYTFVPLLTTTKKGATIGRETQMEHTLSGEAVEGLQSVLGKPWDLIVVGNMSIQGTGYYQTFGWRDVPLGLKRLIRDRTQAGAGLVFLSSGSSAFLHAYKRLGVDTSWPIAVSSEAAHVGFSFPFHRPALTFRKLGRGRLVLLNSGLPFMYIWDPPQRERPEGFVVPGIETTRVVFPTEEYRYAALVKSLLWAAGRDPSPQITELAPKAAALAGEPFTIDIALSDTPAEGAVVGAAFWDRFSRQTLKATGEATGRRCAVAVPGMAEGAYVVDCVLRNAKGEALDWAACSIRVRGERKLLSAQTDRDYYEPGDTARVTVKIANADGLKLAHRLIDTYGRLVHLGTAPARESVEVTLPLAMPLSRLHYLWLELLTADGKVLSVHRQPVIARPDRPSDYHWYQAGGWSSNFAVQLVAAGVDHINLPSGSSDITDITLESNMGVWGAWSHIGAGYAGRANAEGTGHSVCPSGPGFRYELRKNFEAALPRAKRFGVDLFMLQDESSSGIGHCDAPPCVFAFQNYLRGMYGTVERLNESWGQDFKSWDEVKRVASKDVARLAPQVDHTMFMRRLYAEWIDQSQGGIRRFIPEARVGFSVSWGDAWELSRYLSMTIWHRRGLYYDYHTSYGRPEITFGSWFGPTYDKSDRNEAQAHHHAWASLLAGANAFFEWWGARHLGYNFVRPDLSLFKVATIMSQEVAEIKAGVGKLLMEAEYVTLPLVLYQSSRSNYASSALKGRSSDPDAAPRPSSESSVRGTLRRIQVPVRYVHSEQVEDGILAEDAIRLVYMSRGLALSDREIEALKGFAENGGILVADYDIGLRDEHGNVRQTAPLEKVFGIKTDTAVDLGDTAELRVEKDFEQIRFSGLKGVLARKGFGAKVTVTTGTALADIDGKVPALIVNRHGKGLALYLNFHPGLVQGEKGADFLRGLCEALVDQAGVVRPFSVVDGDGRRVRARLRVGTFHNGEQMYVGFLADPEGYTLAEQDKMDVALKCTSEGYLYDVRRRKFLGKRKELALTVTPGVAELYSLLPYSVEGVEISLAGDAIAPGKVARAQAKVRISAEKPGDHVLVTRVSDPTGRHRKEHDQNIVAKGGVCSAEVPIALNDPSGEWKLEFRDVASGVVATATFRVSK